MRKILCLIVFLFIALSGYSQNLDQFLGLWEMKSDKGSIYESWQKSAGNVFKGVTYQLNNQDTVIFETVELKYRNNVLGYGVKDQTNAPEVVFNLIKFSEQDHTYIFENLANEYPQRIIYHFAGNDRIDAKIEGTVNGLLKSQNFNYSKVK